jgi:hypothetical protein
MIRGGICTCWISHRVGPRSLEGREATSLSGIEAAHAAGVAAIGYADRAWKSDAFVTADAVVTSMGEIAAVLNG